MAGQARKEYSGSELPSGFYVGILRYGCAKFGQVGDLAMCAFIAFWGAEPPTFLTGMLEKRGVFHRSTDPHPLRKFAAANFLSGCGSVERREADSPTNRPTSMQGARGAYMVLPALVCATMHPD
jgi:hypothetical protein